MTAYTERMMNKEHTVVTQVPRCRSYTRVDGTMDNMPNAQPVWVYVQCDREAGLHTEHISSQGGISVRWQA